MLRRAMIQALPTCTLWRYDMLRDVWCFALFPWIIVSRYELWQQTRSHDAGAR